MAQKRKQQSEELHRSASPSTPGPTPTGELEAVQEQFRVVQEQQAKIAIAARLLREKQIISPTAEQSQQFIEQIVQKGGQ